MVGLLGRLQNAIIRSVAPLIGVWEMEERRLEHWSKTPIHAEAALDEAVNRFWSIWKNI